jgi:hypothetical protein
MLGLNLLSGISIFFFSNSGPWGIVIGIPVITSWFTLLISLVSIGVLLFAGAQAYLGRQIFLLAFMIQTILQVSLLFGFGLTQVISGEDGLLKMFQRLFIPELTTWDGLVNYIIQSFINSVVNSLILPVGIIGSTLLYFDQRIRKEGFDIEMRVTDTVV